MSKVKLVRFDHAPPSVSKRNHFNPAEELVDFHFHELPKVFRAQEMRVWLTRFVESVIRRLSHAFEEGARRGVAQTTNLLCDPEFYATAKQRRNEHRRRMKESEVRQRAETLEREQCPTQEQIMEDIQRLEQWIADYEDSIAGMKKRLEQLKEMKPKNVRIM